MKELLSNNEIDTLLAMFRADEAPMAESVAIRDAVDKEHGAVISPVDLLKPNRLTREHMVDLERLFDTAAKHLGTVMTDKLRFEMECDCVAVEQIRFQRWLTMIGSSNCIYILKVPDVSSPLLCTMTTSLLYASVDRILGGEGKVNEVPKDLSDAEYTVADAFMEPCIDRLARSIDKLLPAGWELGNRFTNPSLAHILPLQDVVLSVHFQVGGDFLLGDLRLVIPYKAVESKLSAVDEDTPRSEQPAVSAREVLGKSVLPVGVDLAVRLGETILPLRQLLELKVGDVVPLQTRLGEPLIAPVQGVPKFKGHVGKLGGRLAYRIASVIES